MQHINATTAFEKKHFNPSSTKVVFAPSLGKASATPNIPLTDLQIIRLAGAPSGSRVTVVPASWDRHDPDDEDDVPPGLYFEVKNAKYISTANVLGIFMDPPTGYGIYIKLVDLKPSNPRGLAGRMIAIIAREAILLGQFTRIRLFAAGGRREEPRDPKTGERWWGFYAWPSYGFDMKVKLQTGAMAQNFQYYPPNIRACGTVSDMLSIPDGKAYWKLVGDGGYMDLDLSSPSSHSVTTLDTFLGKAGI